MSNQIACPVCNRSAIEINICPNCQTDLTLIRMLHDLPSVSTISPPHVAPQTVAKNWQAVTLLIAMLASMGLGLCLFM